MGNASREGRELPFVDRTIELGEFDRLLGGRKLLEGGDENKPDQRNLLIVNGLEGSGRTRLLEEFGSRCRENDVPHVRIDLGKRHLENPFGILADIGEGLEQVGIIPGGRGQKIKSKAEGVGDGLDVLKLWAERPLSSNAEDYYEFFRSEWFLSGSDLFEELFYEIGDEKFVLAIDRGEGVSPELMDWVEHFVVDLGLNGVVVLVSPGRLRRPELRCREKLINLGGLGEPETVVACEAVGLDGDLARVVYQTTDGFPAAVAMVAERVEEWQERGIVDLEQTRMKLIGLLGIEFLDRYTSQLPADIGRIFHHASLLRIIDAKMLERVKNVVGIERGDGGEDLLDLRRQGLVYWGRGGYIVVDPLRQIAGRYIELFDRSNFEKVNRVAVEYYRKVLEEFPDFRPLWAGEVIYHLARLGDWSGADDFLRDELVEAHGRIRDRSYFESYLRDMESWLREDKELIGLAGSDRLTGWLSTIKETSLVK